MDIQLFINMLQDTHFPNYEKMKYKYRDDFGAFINTLSDLYYKPVPLADFGGNNIVYIENHAAVNQNTVKLLLQAQKQHYGL